MTKDETVQLEVKTEKIQKKEWAQPTLTLMNIKMTYASTGSGVDFGFANNLPS